MRGRFAAVKEGVEMAAFCAILSHMDDDDEIDFQPADWVEDPETGEVLAIEHGVEYARAMTAFHARECSHPETTPMRVRVAGGNVQVRNCCTVCGDRTGTAISQKKDPAWVASLPWQSDELAGTYKSRRHTERRDILLSLAKKQYAERGRFTRSYHAYLESGAWRAKRALVLKRCGNVCEGCGLNTATEVHHVHYDHLFNEFLFELLGLCGDCHDRIEEEKQSRRDDDDVEPIDIADVPFEEPEDQPL